MNAHKILLGPLAAAAVAGLLSMGGAGAAFAQNQTFITIGTGGPTGVYFVAGNSICRMLAKVEGVGRKGGREHGIRCAAPSSAGSTFNLGKIAEGDFDFGVVQSDWQFHSVNGTRPDRVVPNPNLRAVFSIHPEPYQIVVSPDSGIGQWQDLIGERFNVGNPGSGQRGTTEELMDRYGTTFGDFGAVSELTSSEQSQALCDGNIDAYGYTVGFPNAGVQQAIQCGATIIDLDDDTIAGLVAQFPYYSFATIPQGTYATLDHDVTTFGVRATFVTDASQSDDVVYEITRAVFENIQDFRNLHPAFANLDPKEMISAGLSAPLHPGAKRYYCEVGLLAGDDCS